MPSFRRRVLAALCLAGSACIAQAACETGLAERLHARLHPGRAMDHVLALCEPWRGQAGRMVVVLPLPRADAGGSPSFDLDVLVVQLPDNGNTDRARVVNRLLEPKALTADAPVLTELRLDKARYVLAPEARAFGLRVHYRGGSSTRPFSRETLSLYVPQGAKLRKVLDGMEVGLERGEWDTDCAGSFEAVRGGVSVVRGAGGGYADLVLRQTRSLTRSLVQGDTCATRERPATFKTVTWRYDGERYLPPKPQPRRRAR